MKTIIPSPKILYKAKTHTIGGRSHGACRSSDSHLHVLLSTPGKLGSGTNPEQLFAAGWSACFGDALIIGTLKRNITLPDEITIDAEVDLCIDSGAYYLQGQLNIIIPGLNKEIALELINEARRICPYTKAIASNMQVAFNLL